jgi:hypothetical protein
MEYTHKFGFQQKVGSNFDSWPMFRQTKLSASDQGECLCNQPTKTVRAWSCAKYTATFLAVSPLTGTKHTAGTEEQCLGEIRKPLSDQAAGGEWDLKDVTDAIQQGATIWLRKRSN